jgi:hypothetical protein
MGQQQQQTTPPPAQRAAGGGTYTNPVWHGYFADPFVLRHEGVYYAYGTGTAPATARSPAAGSSRCSARRTSPTGNTPARRYRP